MIESPHCPQKKPYRVQLEEGEYYFCACGLSQTQPFCDGKHKSTPFVPKRFKIMEERFVSLCGCKHTKNTPHCDGSHASL